jgi:hypothetical protein
VQPSSCGVFRNGLCAEKISNVVKGISVKSSIRTVFGDIVQIVPANDDGAVHFR